MKLHIASEAAMEALGGKLAKAVSAGCSIYLSGPLGAGKTTLVRGFLRAMGHTGTTKSPTYTLVESYRLGTYEIHHFDLYRVNDPEELEYIGIRDYFAYDGVIYIVEWPERGGGVLPKADLKINILYDGTARKVSIKAGSVAGHVLLDRLK